MLDINELTFGQIKEIAALSNCGTTNKEIPFKKGEKYLIRTVTHIDVGMVKDVLGGFIIMDQASWIADTGRYHDCLKKGVFNEVEPYPTEVYINSSAIIDAAPWSHNLPTEQK